MLRNVTAAIAVSMLALAAAPVANSAPAAPAGLTKDEAAKLLWQDSVDFYVAELESGAAKEFGVEDGFVATLNQLLVYEALLSSNFDLMVAFITEVDPDQQDESRKVRRGGFADDSSLITWGQLTGTQAFEHEGPLPNVYTRNTRYNVFGGVIGYHYLCAQPSVEPADCRVGFGDGTGPAPICKVPRAVAAPQVTGQQCSWISCPGIKGWPDGWSYRCCTITFVCTQDFFLFDCSVTNTLSLYAAKC